MAGNKKADWKNVLLVYTPLVSLFLLICIHQKLMADIDAGNWQKIAVRVGLVALASFLVVRRFEVPLKIRLDASSGSLRRLLVAVIFLALLFYPLISQLSSLTKGIKEVTGVIFKDQHSLSQKMQALFTSFPKAFEEYTSSSFNLPKSLIHFQALVKIYGLGVSPNNNVALGKNGFFFEGWGASRVEKGIVENFDNIADYLGQIPFSKAELRQWKRTLEERKYWLKEQGSEYVFVLAPTKALVYPEHLPSNLQNVRKGQTRYDQLSQFLGTSADIHFIDVRPSLLQAKENSPYPLLFYKTDFHWNFYGAFIAYRTIVEQLITMFPEYELHQPEISDFELSIDKHWAHQRFIDMVGLPVSLHKNEHYITMVPKKGGRYDAALDLPPQGISDVYPPERPVISDNGEAMNLRLVLNPQAPLRSLLLLGDSFLEKCVYFFSGDAQRVLNYRTIVNFPEEILRYEKPDIVIQEILNMFILRPPPQNPSGFAASYLRGKFFDNADSIVAGKNDSEFIQKMDGDKRVLEIHLPDSPDPMEEEVRIARMILLSQAQGDIGIHLYDTENRKLTELHQVVTKGSNDIFFEFPPQKIGRIIFSSEKSPIPELALKDFEVRSDAATIIPSR